MPGMAILCAVDFSDTSALALACAREIADHHAQPLTIVAVGDPLLAAAEQVHVGRDATVGLRQALDEFVEARIGRGRAQGQHLVVRTGDAVDEILRVAGEAHAQLIVLGSRGRTGVQKAVFGSIAERVLRGTSLPVLVVPPAFADSSRHVMGSLREVLVPVDFHDHAIDDARVAARIARASHARLHLLHVVQAGDASRWNLLPPSAAAHVGERLAGSLDGPAEQATAALQRLADALELEPAPSIAVVDGRVAEQVTDVARRRPVDLVVMGLCGQGRGRIGSTAYRVLSTSSVPVLGLPGEHPPHVLGFLG